MAVEPNTDVADDLASAPVANEALTVREADDAIAALFDRDPETDPTNDTQGDDESADDVTDEPTDEEGEDEALPEVVDDVDDDEPDASPDYAEGRFAADDAKVKLEDGTTISIAELKRNNLFQRDYSKKTEEIARERDAVKAKEAEISQVSEQVAKEREYALWYLETHAPQEPERPALSAQQDPMAWLEYQQKLGEYQAVVSAWQTMHQGKQAEEQRKQQESQQQIQERIAEERTKLFEAYPILKDDAKRPKWFEETFSEAEANYGFSQQEMSQITDHRMLKVLRDANLYRRARAKAPEVQKAVQARPALVQGSGKRQNPDQLAARQNKQTVERLRQSGRVQDADAAILKLLG